MATDRVLVTGGSGGIGAAVCAVLAARGHHPIVGYASNETGACTVAAACGGMPLHLNLANARSIDSALDTLAQADTTPVAGVVLAAAAPPRLSRIGQIDDAELAGHLQIAAIGTRHLLAGLLARFFRPRRHGTVVAVLSQAMGGEDGRATASMGAYVIAKYAQQGVLAALVADYPWLGVGAVRPGFVDTGMLQAFDARFIQSVRERGGICAPAAVAAEICGLFDALSSRDQ